ncbi:MAG: transporter [Acidimicrobiales bacterium]|nr:transporter [Acidimicrobiales bacterium]
MGGARTWGAAAVVAVVAAVAGPSVAGAAEPAVELATTLTGSRVPGGGDPHGLGGAWIRVVDGALCAELNLAATSVPAGTARLVGPAGAAVDLPPFGADGRSSGCVDGAPESVLTQLATSPARFAVEVPGVVRGGLLPTAKEGTLMATRLGSLEGSAVATVAANPEQGRLCTEVPGGGRLRRLGDGAVVAELPERGCVRGLAPDEVEAVTLEPGRHAVETATGRGLLAIATEFAGAAVPRFGPGPCPEVVPPDPRFACGTLTVAEDRQDPGGPTVELPVAVLRSASATPAPDPVVYFEGGPGYGAVEIADLFLEGDYGGDRDVILFDQRGTGGARPSLDCPEVDEAIWEGFASTDPTEVELERTLAAYDACRRRLTDEGVDLDDYDTTTSADDAEDLRVALGVERWNLFGVSRSPPASTPPPTRRPPPTPTPVRRGRC